MTRVRQLVDVVSYKARRRRVLQAAIAFAGDVLDRAFVYLICFVLQVAVFIALGLRWVVVQAVVLAIFDVVVARHRRWRLVRQPLEQLPGRETEEV